MSATPSILHVDDGWLAVDKPSGWLVHPAGTEAPDLVSWLASVGEGTLAPVHRLDRGTSGVVLFAPHAQVEAIASRFREEAVEKRYLALVFGQTRPHGVIRRPLQDGRRGRPLASETRYRTRTSFERWSLLEVRPVTGRKHQIRRHLQSIGHALIGDDRYRPRGRPTVPHFPGRLWLHCASIATEGLTIEAPLAPELQRHLDQLEARRM